jgi:hypothetical protein
MSAPVKIAARCHPASGWLLETDGRVDATVGGATAGALYTGRATAGSASGRAARPGDFDFPRFWGGVLLRLSPRDGDDMPVIAACSNRLELYSMYVEFEQE